MANGTNHCVAAAVTVGLGLAVVDKKNNVQSARPLIGAALASAFTNLPDMIEPANHPNHRKFFHSLTIAGLVGWGAYKAYKWEPTEPFDEAVRFVALVGAVAYLIHLALDATTPKSLPLVG